MSILLDKLTPPPHKPEISDQALVKKQYNYWRTRVFYSMYIGYALYYLTRKCLAFAMPSLIHDLGYDKGQLGILTTTLAISYGISKFVSGLIGDRSNPRYFMAIGLMATGVFNIFFGLSSSLFALALFWGLNGWFQGFGWPSCTRLLSHWYSKSERGRWWSIWATSQNIGGSIIPLCVAYLAQIYGWRSAMIFPGIIVIFGGFFLLNRLCDTPQSLGLPPIEKFRSDYPPNASQETEKELSVKEILFTYVLTNKFLWILGIGYFFVYLIRQAINDWTILYLVETKGYSQLGAGAVVFWFEMGGIAGGILAGWLSDRVFSGNRGPVNALFCLLSIGAIIGFSTSRGNTPFLDSSFLFIIGLLIFGPLILIGIAAAELSHKKAAATATGFIGCIAYLGAATAGYPLGIITQTFGWEGYFITLTTCSIFATLSLLPLWKLGVRAPSQLAV
jgi:OPA family sugar phosphate sensor protein UhpC-like MFS transporter